MSVPSIGRFTLLLAIGIAALAWTPWAVAEPFPLGPKACQDCHKDEYKIWEESKHFKSYRTAHKADDAEKIAKAVGGKKSMKRNVNCVVCHYSTVQKEAGAKAKVKAGPACESCHGASSDWEPIHFEYGGKDVKREDETPDHKAKRIADSTAAGLVWASMSYDIAHNCLKCHGLARSEIDGEAFAKMLEAGHPINQSFEIVMFSQGKMHHSLDKLSPAQLADLFVAGQAAKLVSATEAAAKTEDAKYKAGQTKRAADAQAVLQALPEAAELIASPSEANARKMMEAFGGKDLSGAIGGQIPCAGSDKENLMQC